MEIRPLAAAGPPVQTETRGVGIRGGTGREQGKMWGQGREWQRWGWGGTLLTWFLNHMLIHPVLPGHQADLAANTGDGEEVGAELRMREPTPSQL